MLRIVTKADCGVECVCRARGGDGVRVQCVCRAVMLVTVCAVPVQNSTRYAVGKFRHRRVRL